MYRKNAIGDCQRVQQCTDVSSGKPLENNSVMAARGAPGENNWAVSL